MELELLITIWIFATAALGSIIILLLLGCGIVWLVSYLWPKKSKLQGLRDALHRENKKTLGGK